MSSYFLLFLWHATYQYFSVKLFFIFFCPEYKIIAKLLKYFFRGAIQMYGITISLQPTEPC